MNTKELLKAADEYLLFVPDVTVIGESRKIIFKTALYGFIKFIEAQTIIESVTKEVIEKQSDNMKMMEDAKMSAKLPKDSEIVENEPLPRADIKKTGPGIEG